MADLARDAGISGEERLLEAAQKLLGHLWQVAWKNAPATRDGDADALHDMRVAIRRARSALQSFEGEKNAPEDEPFVAPHLRREMNAQRKKLGKLGDALGAVRDHDVLSDYLEEYAKKQLQTPIDDASGLGEFRKYLQKERANAFGKMEKRLDKASRPGAFKEEFARFALGLPAADGPNPPLKTALQTLLPARKAEVLSHAPSLDDEHDELGQHELRKALKRLRYSFEFFAPGFDFPVKSRIKQITQLQDTLGEMQDRTVLREKISEAFGSEKNWPDDIKAFVDYGTARRAKLLKQACTRWAKLKTNF